MSDLSLISTEDLFDELSGRYDSLLLVWARDLGPGVGAQEIDYLYKSWIGAFGLSGWARYALIRDGEPDNG